jgi:molybdopterin-guanine dinucleotide biosynthesis protein A
MSPLVPLPSKKVSLRSCLFDRRPVFGYTPAMSGANASIRDAVASVVVLAGGSSSRLGRDKALLPIDGQPMLARTVETLSALSDDLIVVSNEPESHRSLAPAARFVPDVVPGQGSLMGVYSGLRVARHAHALVIACDMPLLNTPLLRYMLGLAQGYDVVIPRLNGLLEPLHSIYGKACLPPISRLLGRGQRKITAFFHEVRVRYVEEDEIDAFDPHRLSFLNVNSLADWDRARLLLEEAPPARRSGA